MAGKEYDYSEYLRKPQPQLDWAKRRCLGCDTMFNSSWIGNRLCNPCKGIVDNRQKNTGWSRGTNRDRGEVRTERRFVLPLDQKWNDFSFQRKRKVRRVRLPETQAAE